MSHRTSRAVVRTAMAAFAVGLIGIADSAFADTPANWQSAPHVSGLDWVLVLLIIPLGIAALITVLVSLGTRNSAGSAVQPWEKQEWFGGPAGATQAPKGSESTGGAGAEF